jgi:hypothetical protein
MLSYVDVLDPLGRGNHLLGALRRMLTRIHHPSPFPYLIQKRSLRNHKY